MQVRAHDARRIGLRYTVDVGLVGDARATLAALLPLLKPKTDRSFLEKIQKEMTAWRELMVYWLDEYLPELERAAARFDACDDLHPSVLRLRSEFRARYARILDTFCAVDFDFERFAEEYWSEVRSKAESAAAITGAA